MVTSIAWSHDEKTELTKSFSLCIIAWLQKIVNVSDSNQHVILTNKLVTLCKTVKHVICNYKFSVSGLLLFTMNQHDVRQDIKISNILQVAYQ